MDTTHYDYIMEMDRFDLCAFLTSIHTEEEDEYGDYDPRLVINGRSFRDAGELYDWLGSSIAEDESVFL